MNNCPKCGAQMNGANCPYCGIDKQVVQQPIAAYPQMQINQGYAMPTGYAYGVQYYK